MDTLDKPYRIVLFQVFALGLIFIGPLLEKIFSVGFTLYSTAPIRLCFIACCMTSCLYFLAAVLNLGKSLTPSPVPLAQSALVTNGLYRFSRHPIYSALLFFPIGWIGFWQSWVSLIGYALLIIILLKKSKLEEQLLLERYGNPYKDYMRTVNRFLPSKKRQ